MSELDLLHDPNFIEKVKLVESVISTMTPPNQLVVRLTMQETWTRDQAGIYAAAVAGIKADFEGVDIVERARRISDAIDMAHLEYDQRR
jgi:adenylylsulfate kinase-like enzyme